MIVGYARTSTTDQAAGLAGQERHLKGAGCERVGPNRGAHTTLARPRWSLIIVGRHPCLQLSSELVEALDQLI
jgi:hypothetical protein